MSNRRKTKEERENKIKKNKERINKNTKIDKTDETTSTVESVLKSMNIKLDSTRESLLIQIFKFVIVGGIATIIDWLIYFILYKFIKLEPIIANIISFSVSVIYNYYASCKYVFKVNKEKSKTRQFTEFIIFSLIGLGINELLIFIFVNKLSWNAMLVKILATLIVMVFNFITRKKFLEK